ncbi:MAG: ABC transporter permease subunit [Myxococcales bacterium]|nr:MAG: ABC transporter permease subunit [Myxococcales bacterium]
MHNAILIARRELGAYLRTPSGYIIAAVVLLLDGLFFTTMAVGDSPKLSSEVLETFFFWAGGLTGAAAVFLSMRLFAEEQASGTQILLFTSPVKESEIVMGKFLSALLFLTVITLLSLYLPALIFVNGKISIGHIAAGYLGMLLLGAACLALGTLGSAIASNQLVALLLGGVLVFVFSVLCWHIARVTDPPLSSMMSYMALYVKHFHPFRRGLLQLSSVVIYLSVIYFSLLASIRILQSKRWQ